MACVVQCTIMKGNIDTTAFGWLWPGIPSHDHTRHTGLDLPQVQEKGKGRRRENVWCHFIWLKEDLEAVRENIADGGHCKIRGIRKVHRIITKPNKPNDAKVYSSDLLHVIIAHNHLPFFKIFWDFVHFSLFQHFFYLFLKNHNPFPLLSRIGPGCIY